MSSGLGSVCSSLYASGMASAMIDDDRHALYRLTNNWFPRGRHPLLQRHYPYHALWFAPGFSLDLAITGSAWNDLDEYDPFEAGEGGKRGTYFINGQVLDNLSAPVGGVVVNGFRTSDNLFVGTDTTNSDGRYRIPTPYIGVSHFVVAYLDIATDTFGTTVNNLTPTSS